MLIAVKTKASHAWFAGLRAVCVLESSFGSKRFCGKMSAKKCRTSGSDSSMMKKGIPAANPDAYVAALDGWRRECVAALRADVRAATKLDEVIKWGHLVYFAKGPVLLIRAEEKRVLFGFWRGQRLREIEPRLKAGGKYEMATLELREGDAIASAVVRKLVSEAVGLNDTLGDPTDVVKTKVSGAGGGAVPRKTAKALKPK